MKQAKDGFNTWTAPKMKVIIPSLETSVSELASAIEKRDLERVPEEMANGDF